MGQATRRRSRWIRYVTAGILAAAAVPAIAAPPNPSLASATVDGDPAEWNLQTDFFSDMIRAGGNGNQTKVESKLYLRYDCATNIMYAFVNAEPGVTISSLPSDAGNNFVKLGVKKQVDATDSTVPAPNFAYVGSNGTTATGWEASFPLAEGTYTDLNVHAQVNDGGSQTSAVPGRAITVTIACGENPPASPLTVSKTASASYVRTFNWSIAKIATPAKIETDKDTATFNYQVTVTKSAPIDSGFTVNGTITVTNPNEFEVNGVDVVDEVAPSTPCPLTNATGRTVPAGGSIQIDYSCPLGAKADGTNQTTATWPAGSASNQAAYAFGAPSSVTNDSVDVTDKLGTDAALVLAGGAGLTSSHTFTYTRTLPVPASGCITYPNIATIAASPQTPSTGNLPQSSTATVDACRTTVSVIGTPTAKLRVTKRGPAKATAGAVVTFTISVKNTSANAATSVVLNDVLPVGYSVFRLPKGAAFKKGKVVWNVGTLAPGATKTVKLRAKIDTNTAGRRCNTATASASNASTASARACTKVIRVAGVAIIPAVTG